MLSDKKYKRNFVKAIRLRAGLSQAQFAQSIGITAHSLREYERQTAHPSTKTIEKIMEVYKYEVPQIIQYIA